MRLRVPPASPVALHGVGARGASLRTPITQLEHLTPFTPRAGPFRSRMGLLPIRCRDAYYPYPYMSSILVIPIYTHRHPQAPISSGEGGRDSYRWYLV